MENNLENQALKLIVEGKIKENKIKSICLAIFSIGVILFLVNQYGYHIYKFDKFENTTILGNLVVIWVIGSSIKSNHTIARRQLKTQLSPEQQIELTNQYQKLKQRRIDLKAEIDELNHKQNVINELIEAHPELATDLEKITRDIHNKQTVLNRDETPWITIRKINKYLNHNGSIKISLNF